ncbi:hypothetical protein BDV96DRAFT_608228 [Lophiotrema nucula]|uniref:Uncharacterized protein n=1 Tax=Lophiotrema nucula TaxID=690887 RepID=A0A6A5YFI1_9PLEO|nr:hypothetical protein BDV96DRAFT_608228 [Lophiotrema nucula]
MAVPLTTTFVPPLQCTKDTWWVDDVEAGAYFLLGGKSYSSCLPPSFTPNPGFFYTPGLHCPQGYETACSSIETLGPETGTVVTCCPSSILNPVLVLCVRAQVLNLDTSKPTSTTPSLISKPTTFATWTSSIAPATTSAPSLATHRGLSTGAKAGISVGAILGVALVGAMIYLGRSIRKKAQHVSPTTDADRPEWVSKSAASHRTEAPDSPSSIAP